MDLNKNIIYHEELGIGPDFVDLEKRFSIGTLAKESIKRKMKFETLSEEMRIFYVACTRAKEKLIITGSISNMERSIERWISSASLDYNIVLPSEVLKGKSYLDWIGMALCQHIDVTKLKDVIGVPNEIAKDDDSKWEINLWNKSDLINIVDLEDINTYDKYESNITYAKSLDRSIMDEVK